MEFTKLKTEEEFNAYCKQNDITANWSNCQHDVYKIDNDQEVLDRSWNSVEEFKNEVHLFAAQRKCESASCAFNWLQFAIILIGKGIFQEIISLGCLQEITKLHELYRGSKAVIDSLLNSEEKQVTQLLVDKFEDLQFFRMDLKEHVNRIVIEPLKSKVTQNSEMLEFSFLNNVQDAKQLKERMSGIYKLVSAVVKPQKK